MSVYNPTCESENSTHHLVRDVLQVRNADLGSIVNNLVLHELNQLGGALDTVDVGEHEPISNFVS